MVGTGRAGRRNQQGVARVRGARNSFSWMLTRLSSRADEVSDRAVFEEGGAGGRPFDEAAFSNEIAEEGEEALPVIIDGGLRSRLSACWRARGRVAICCAGVDLTGFPGDKRQSTRNEANASETARWTVAGCQSL